MTHKEYVNYYNDCIDKNIIPEEPKKMFDDWQAIANTYEEVSNKMHNILIKLNSNIDAYDEKTIESINNTINCLDNASRKKQTILAQYNQVLINVQGQIAKLEAKKELKQERVKEDKKQ